MAKYLIDANLPYFFGLWNNPDYIHVKDLDDSWSDELIWDVIEKNLIDHSLINVYLDRIESIK